MKISRKEVTHVARLARLKLDQKQVELFTTQLNTVLEYMEKLQEVDTSKVKPTFHVTPMHNVFREDDVRPSLSKDEPLKNAPEKTEDCFVVPKVI